MSKKLPSVVFFLKYELPKLQTLKNVFRARHSDQVSAI